MKPEARYILVGGKVGNDILFQCSDSLSNIKIKILVQRASFFHIMVRNDRTCIFKSPSENPGI
jgi:hypothetical protein